MQTQEHEYSVPDYSECVFDPFGLKIVAYDSLLHLPKVLMRYHGSAHELQ